MKSLKHLLEKIQARLFNREVTTYILFGIATTAVSFASYIIFVRYLGFGVALSNTLSHFLAILFAYVTNKIWVFRALDFSFQNIVREFFKFLSGRLVTWAIDTSLLVILVDMLGYDAILSRVFTTAIVVILNYLVSKLLVFRKRHEL